MRNKCFFIKGLSGKQIKNKLGKDIGMEPFNENNYDYIRVVNIRIIKEYIQVYCLKIFKKL